MSEKIITMELKDDKWNVKIVGINPLEALRAGNILMTEALSKFQDVSHNKIEVPKIDIPKDMKDKIIDISKRRN